jgi:hypothetical protein
METKIDRLRKIISELKARGCTQKTVNEASAKLKQLLSEFLSPAGDGKKNQN